MNYIGRLKHKFWNAVLLKTGVWKCSNNDIQNALNTGYSVQNGSSPSQGARGYSQLYEAAKDMDAEVVDVADPPKVEEDVIY